MERRREPGHTPDTPFTHFELVDLYGKKNFPESCTLFTIGKNW
jgi:hypothetical protein